MDEAWVKQLISVVKRIIPKTFFGKIEINCQGGGISNVNLTTSIKDTEETGK